MFRGQTLSCLASSTQLILAVSTLLLVGNCSQEGQKEEQPLARVENKSLTGSQLDETLRLNYFSPGEAAERWIDDQVLLEHAAISNLVDRKSITDRLQGHEQLLIAGLLLDSLLQDYIRISPEQIREYYANNLHDFQFRDAAALVLHIGFLRMADALEALEQLQGNATARDSILSHYKYDYQLVYRHQLIPVLDEAVFLATAGPLYGPITSEFGYHVFLVERFFNEGDTIPFALVRKQIYERLFQIQMPLARSTVLDSLREMLDIEVYHD